jgi:hypothetical protein
MKTKHNFRERRKALVFLGIDEKGGERIHFFGDPKRYPAPLTVRRYSVSPHGKRRPMLRMKEWSGFFLKELLFKAVEK